MLNGLEPKFKKSLTLFFPFKFVVFSSGYIPYSMNIGIQTNFYFLILFVDSIAALEK